VNQPLLGHLYATCPVPEDLEAVTTMRPGAEVYPPSVGVETRAVKWIWRAVERLYQAGIHPAISICVRRRGRILLERSIGYARGNGPSDPPGSEKVLATPDTPFCVASASKAVTAMLLHHLDETDQVRLDDPVCEYIPEFGCRGKEAISLRHVLNHRAGVPNPPPDTMDPALLGDPDRIVELLCEQEPLWRPGTRLAYHAVTTGFLLGEVVRRVTGKDIRAYLDEVLRKPLGLRWMSYGVRHEDLGRVATNVFTGPAPFWPVSMLMRRALGIDYERAVEILNDSRFLTSIFPSGNVVSNAEELCRFFEVLRVGGTLDGVRVFDRRTVVRATAEQSYLEPDMTLVLPFRYGSGFMLGAEWFSLYGPFTRHAFGHLGLTNVFGWADPDRDVSVAILTNGKPLIYPEIYFLFEVLRRIGSACPQDGTGIGSACPPMPAARIS